MAQDGTTAGGASYTLDNVTFPVGRNKLQSIFDAIRSTNIGNTAPDLVAGQFWIDNNTPSTTVWTLYLYDGTDSIQFATIDTINNTVNFIDSTFTQLSSNLDLNSYTINGTGNIDITGSGTFSGDLTVDTNTLYVDSTNNRVGVGTTSPSTVFHIKDSVARITLEDSDVTNAICDISGGGAGNLTVRADPNNLVASSYIGLAVDGATQLNITSSETVINDGSADHDFRVESNNNTHALFVDGGSDITLFGKSSPNSTTTGTELYSSGIAIHTVNGNRPLLLNRLTSDGDIIELRKDGTKVGIIGTYAGDITIGTTDTGLRFDDGASAYIPWNTTTNQATDGTISLGATTVQYNNLYLSGTVTNDGSGGMSIDTSGNVTFNDGSIDADFRVESNNNTHALFVDGGNDAVGIGASTVTKAKLNIKNNGVDGTYENVLAFQYAGNANENNIIGSTVSSSASSSGIYFGISDGGGASTTKNMLEVTRGDVVVNEDSVDADFRVESDTNTHALFVEGSSGEIGVGTSSPSAEIHISKSADAGNAEFLIENSFTTAGSTDETVRIQGRFGGYDASYIVTGKELDFTTSGNRSSFMSFWTRGAGTLAEALRINSSGNVLVGKTTFDASATDGISLTGAGSLFATRTGDSSAFFNRNSSDGIIIEIRQDANTEGTISVSGATVSYNGFTGTHWSRLSDNSKPTILKGTILESLDEMMDWYQIEFDITDEEGNTTTQKQSYALGDGESVGDVITYTYQGTDYQATIIQEDDVKHTKSKVSDTVDAKNVYGVFMDWDNDDDTVNDMYVAQTGTFVVRLNSSVTTLNKGDLIQSNGDGTGKVQADDIIRSSTVAKVLSTTKIETYEDGSYIVPCSLHC